MYICMCMVCSVYRVCVVECVGKGGSGGLTRKPGKSNSRQSPYILFLLLYWRTRLCIVFFLPISQPRI